MKVLEAPSTSLVPIAYAKLVSAFTYCIASGLPCPVIDKLLDDMLKQDLVTPEVLLYSWTQADEKWNDLLSNLLCFGKPLLDTKLEMVTDYEAKLNGIEEIRKFRNYFIGYILTVLSKNEVESAIQGFEDARCGSVTATTEDSGQDGIN